MRTIFLLLVTFFIAVSCIPAETSPLSDELDELDKVLTMSDDYDGIKVRKIASIEEMLDSPGLSTIQKYDIYDLLYKEYVAYQFDRAKEVLDRQLELAEEAGDRSLENSTLINKAHLFTTAGMYLEASQVFDRLDTLSFNYHQKVSWYNARQRFLLDYQEYVRNSGIVVKDADKIRYYQELILKNTPKNSPENHHIRIMLMIEDGKFEEAYQENLRILEDLNVDSRDFAVQAYWQGFICENLNKAEETVRWWIESAKCDIRNSIKDNAALCSVAIKLTDPNETDRAFRYIRLSLDDAVFYNAKLRKVQIASTFPWIEAAYRDSKERQIEERNTYLAFTTFAAVLLLLISSISVKLYLRQKKTASEVEDKNKQLAEYMDSIVVVEENLRKSNLDLIEANAAKEEYLGLFLSMCSGYLDKLKKTISREQYDAELRNFYKTFDTSFLSLYPAFVDEFNSLLKEDCRIILKEGELLNTELRIFALIKLGITQSSHIASLLRYSVNTIYNYRAQIKNATLKDRDNFEDAVKKIGSKK